MIIYAKKNVIENHRFSIIIKKPMINVAEAIFHRFHNRLQYCAIMIVC